MLQQRATSVTADQPSEPVISAPGFGAQDRCPGLRSSDTVAEEPHGKEPTLSALPPREAPEGKSFDRQAGRGEYSCSAIHRSVCWVLSSRPTIRFS
jgi:hypothetical protein